MFHVRFMYAIRQNKCSTFLLAFIHLSEKCPHVLCTFYLYYFIEKFPTILYTFYTHVYTLIFFIELTIQI